MTQWNVGEIVRFGTYRHSLPGVPLVFASGEAMVIIESEADRVVRCARADYDGRPIMEITDTLFAEELDHETEPE